MAEEQALPPSLSHTRARSALPHPCSLRVPARLPLLPGHARAGDHPDLAVHRTAPPKPGWSFHTTCSYLGQNTSHMSLCAPGTRLLHWDATSPPFLRLHPEHLPPMSRALCSKATGCSLIQFRMQPGRAPGPSAPQDMPSATMNTVISISHPPGAELCRDGALQLRAGGKQKLSREGYLAPAGHSPLLFTLAWTWPG